MSLAINVHAPATLRRRTYDLLECARESGLVARLVRGGILLLIVLNVAALFVESYLADEHPAHALLHRLELISVAVFSAEYLARLWACVEDPRFTGRFGRLRFALTPMALVDLLAVLPSLLLISQAADLRALRAARLVRFGRVFKLARHSEAMSMLARVMWERRTELLAVAWVMFLSLLALSTLVYFAERAAQPAVFTDMGTALWWGIVTVTTIGYGDAVPITTLGKVIASLLAVLSIGLFAVPAGIIGEGWLSALRAQRQARQTEPGGACPHCGQPLPEPHQD